MMASAIALTEPRHIRRSGVLSRLGLLNRSTHFRQLLLFRFQLLLQFDNLLLREIRSIYYLHLIQIILKVWKVCNTCFVDVLLNTVFCGGFRDASSENPMTKVKK